MRLPSIIAKASVNGSGMQFDEVRRDQIAADFRNALTADMEEEARAELVYEIHRTVMSNYALYGAVMQELGSRFKNAIREYLTIRARKPTDEQNFIPDWFRDRPATNNLGRVSISVNARRNDQLEDRNRRTQTDSKQ
jgi:hypothetical protein